MGLWTRASGSISKGGAENDEKWKKRSKIGEARFTRLFGNCNKSHRAFRTEEALQSPGRWLPENFLHHRPTAVFGLVVFVLIFLFVMIGPKFYMPINLGYSDSSASEYFPRLLYDGRSEAADF